MTPADLYAFLERHIITNNQLAKGVGVAPRTVRSWLIGDRKIPEPVCKLLSLVDQGQLTFEQIATA
jgi:DNA-binding transcriptional regulator YiaG